MKYTALLTVSCAAVALVGAACRSKEAATPAPTGAESPAAAAPAGASSSSARFERTLELQGLAFRVTCPNDSSINQLEIVPAGLEIDNQPIRQDVDGSVSGAEVADLDANGSPELYVYVQSAGSGSYGSLAAYAANNRKSLSAIALPSVADNPKVSKGYMGHDEFAVVENRLVQRFPIYLEGDTNAKPTGGMRQIQYKLVAGEAGWLLVIDKVVEY